MVLKGVVSGRRYYPPGTVLYGPPKLGKTTFGGDAPSPIFVCTEKGAENLDVDRFEVAKTWEQLLDNMKTVASGEHEYKTVVIDTLNGAVDLASQKVCKEQFKGNWGPGGYYSYGNGPSSTSEEMRRFIPLLNECKERKMLVLILAHTGVMNVKNPIDGDYQKFAPDVDKKIWAKISAWSDVILRGEFDHSIAEVDGKVRAVSTNKRIIKTIGSLAEDAGCRVGYDLPEQLPLSWNAFQEALGHGDDIEAELKKRWHLLDADNQKAAMKYMGIDSLKNLKKAQSRKAKTVLNKLKVIEAKQE